MSEPKALFFDTSVVIAVLNLHPTEKEVSDQVIEFSRKHPHASRHIVSPCLIELYYKTRKKFSASDIRKNLDSLSIELFPISEEKEKIIYDKYCELTYKGEYDFADFSMCYTAQSFKESSILTMDNEDLPLALSRSYTATNNSGAVNIQLFKT